MSKTKVIRESSFEATTNLGHQAELTYKILSDGEKEDTVLIIKEIYASEEDETPFELLGLKLIGHLKDGTLIYSQSMSLKLSTFKELFERVFI